MIPHQIYCDYLEDRGFDCRLLRTIEEEGITVTSLGWDNYAPTIGNGLGDGWGLINDNFGCGWNYGNRMTGDGVNSWHIGFN